MILLILLLGVMLIRVELMMGLIVDMPLMVEPPNLFFLVVL